jgi:hypothetical protein
LPRVIYDKPAIIKGFKNTLTQQIQYSVFVNFQIQGKMFKNTLLLETNLGDRRDFQLIIGLRFLAHHQINLHCADRRLLFLQKLPPSGTWKSDILVPQQNLHRKLNVEAQKNVQRRDRLWNVAESSTPTAALAQPDVIQPNVLLIRQSSRSFSPYQSSWIKNNQSFLRKMKDVLQKKPSKTPFRNFFFYTKRPNLFNRKLLMIPELGLNVCLISHDAYYQNQKQTSNHF